MSMTFFDRLQAWITDLRLFVPAVAVLAAAALLRHPAVVPLLLVFDALMMVGVCCILGLRRESTFIRTASRRGLPFLLLLAGYALLVALLIAYPLQWLQRDRSLGATIAVSTEAVVAVLGLWRFWPVFGLLFVWRKACPSQSTNVGVGAAIARCSRLAHQLTGHNEVFFSHGLIVALGVLALAVGAMAIGAAAAMSAPEMQLVAIAIYGLAITPLVCVVIANRCATALLLELRRQRRERAVPAAAQPAPTLDAQTLHVAAPDKQPTPADLNAKLLRCARAGQTDLALAALAHGADPNTLPPSDDRDQRSVVVLATLGTDMRLLRGLIAKGADLNRAHAGLTPLIAATRDSHQGRPEAVMTLLTNGADPRCVDPGGNSALHYAALSATPIVCALLCDAAAPLDAVNRDGLSPLAMACAAGNWALARFLLERGAKMENERAQPALLSAAACNDDDPTGAELLLKRKARVDACDALGRTALMIAALHGNAAIAEVLIDAGAQVGATDTRGTTALMEAARSGADVVVELIAQRDSALDAADAMGRTALIIASQSRKSGEATIRLLLQAGASPDVRTSDGKRAVDFAAAAGRWNIVALLDPDYPLPASVADSPTVAPAGLASPPHLLDALRFGHWNIVETFEAPVRAWPVADLEVLYIELAEHEPPASRIWLIDHGLRPQATDDGGASVLDALLARLPRAADAACEWHQHGASPSGIHAIIRVCAALSGAGQLRPKLENLALDMIGNGADPFLPNGDGRTPLAHAVAAGSSSVVQALLDRGVDPNVRDRQGRTPLFDALALPVDQADAIIRRLIRAGASPEIAAINGETPLGLALGRPELRRWFNWQQWKLPARPPRGEDLPAAAALGDLDAITKLLDLDLPIHSVDAQGADALLRAAGSGHAALIGLLLDRGADPARAAPSGATPLSAAVTARREAAVATLLERGVAVDSRLPTGATPLMIAAALGFPEIVTRLLARGAQVNARDERGTSSLHAAAQFAFRSSETDSARRVLQLLLEHGADVNASNASGQTPLLLLLGARAEPGSPADQKHLLALLPLFLLAHADIDLQDQRGVGPLHACAIHGLLLPARALLAAKADPGRRDVLDRSPRQVAQLLGYIDLAAELGQREPAAHAVDSQAIDTRG
jgi:ankyrin repeat protein